MHASRTQFSPGASRTRQQAATKRALDLLETAIYNDYGYQIKMGAELEYVISCNHDLPNEQRLNPFGLKDIMAKREGYDPSCERMPSNKDQFFPESPYVAYSYRENAHRFPDYACETVFSHLADYGPKDPTADRPLLQRASYLADAIVGVRDVLLRGTTHRKWREFRDKYVSEVSFAPSRPRRDYPANILTNGLHVNFSLNKRNGGPMMQHEYAALESYLTEAAADGMALLGQSPADRKRYEIKGAPLDQQFPIVSPDPHSHPGVNEPYIEHRLAPASCDPHMAMIVALVGVYRGLAKLHYTTRETTADVPERAKGAYNVKLTKVYDEASKRAADPDNVIRTTLNQLDPDHKLGDTIMDAPPPPELGGVAKSAHRA